MVPLINFHQLKRDAILTRVRAALESDNTHDHLAEYVASVDWSGVKESGTIGRLLGEVELLNDSYIEREIPLAQYRDELQDLVERSQPVSVAG